MANKIKLRNKLIYLAIVSFIAANPARTLAGSENNVQFVTQSGPPPGFEDAALDVAQSNYISVYYGDQFLGNVMGTYGLNTVQFQGVDALVEKIPGIIDPKAVEAALEGKLPNNADHLCANSIGNKKPYCSALSPAVAGVIFDANNYRATIFVNPKYLNAEQVTQAGPHLGDSTAGFSYLGNNVLSLATSSGTNTYSLNNQSIFADGNGALNINSNLTQTDVAPASGAGGSSSTSFALQTVNITRFSNGKYYQYGMFNPLTGNFIGAPPVIGVSMQNYGILPSDTVGSPIEVFLPLPSQVTVYKNGYLISSQSFDSGKHFLDTSSFPTGSYDVSLKIINNIGQTTTQTQFFVKQSALPPRGDPNYQVSLGILQTTESSTFSGNNVSMPSFIKEPIFTYSETRAVGYSFGLQSAIVSNFNRAYLTETLSYYGVDWQLSPGVLVSNNKQYGTLFNASFTPVSSPSFNFTSNNQKIFNPDNGGNTSSTNQTGPDFSPVSASTLQSTNTATWAIGQSANLSLSLQYNAAQNEPGQTQYGASWTQTLFTSPLMTWQLSASATDSTGSTPTYTIGLNASFNTVYDIGVNAGLGYSNANTITNTNGSSYNVYKPTYNLGASKEFYWGENQANNLSLNATASRSYSSDSNLISSNFTTSLFEGALSFSNTVSRNFTNDNGSISSSSSSVNQMSGTITSDMVYSHGHFSFGYQQGSLSGLMVDVAAPEKDKVDVFVNNNKVGQVETNSAKAFYVPSYASYGVTIQPAGQAQYGFDDQPKRVTLYSGNIQYLTWSLTEEYVLFAQIVDAQNKPLPNLLLISKNPSDFTVTDDSGYVQASLPTNETHLSFKNIDGVVCTVTLEPTEIKRDEQQDLVVLNHPLVCH